MPYVKFRRCLFAVDSVGSKFRSDGTYYYCAHHQARTTSAMQECLQANMEPQKLCPKCRWPLAFGPNLAWYCAKCSKDTRVGADVEQRLANAPRLFE